MFRLRIVSGKAKGKLFVFDEQSVVVGRGSDCDLVLYDRDVSRRHCVIEKLQGHYVLRDLGSKNGIQLNGTRKDEVALSDGAAIKIGPIELEVELEFDDTEPGALQSAALIPSSVTARKKLEHASTSLLKPDALRQIRSKAESQVKQPDARQTDTGSFKALRQLPGWHPWRWDAQTRRYVLWALFLGIASIFIVNSILSTKPLPDRSTEVFPADGSLENKRIGAGRKVDVFTPRGAAFQFSFGQGRVKLSYNSGGISTGEVDILVNGERMSTAVTSESAWVLGQKVLVPRPLLRRGTNILRFVPIDSKTDNRWAIARVRISESPLPKGDTETAERYYKLGVEAYRDRRVSPEYLLRALDYFQLAIDYLETIEPLPGKYDDAYERLLVAQEELNRIRSDLTFQAETASRLGEYRRAADDYRKLLLYLEKDASKERRDIELLITQLEAKP